MMTFMRFPGNEILLGTLIALYSIFTAFASWQSSVASSNAERARAPAMQDLNDGNAEYVSANQFIVYDYTMYDGWVTSDSEEIAAYYESSYSEAFQNAIATDPENPFSEEYYDAMNAVAYEYWDSSDANSEVAGQWNNRGDGLQLVMLIMALGVAFAAWASLLKEESHMRVLFAIFAILTLLAGVITYLGVPTVI
jgi:hypothetical protein